MSFPDNSNVIDAPGFFEVRSRGGDPSTEELHSRASRIKRFKNGPSYALRGTRGSDASLPPFAASIPNVSAAVLETDTHSVVRAGAVPAAAAAAASSARLCSGKVLSHGWSFLFADGAVFAWEQMMIAAERPAAVASADQACLRFDHPALATDLAAVRVLEEVWVEASDLVVLTQPWKASGGKRELLLISPVGLARYWPDLHSPRRFTDIDARSIAPGKWVTRAVSLGPADFICGLSNGGVMRLRPGIAQPRLLAETSSSMFSFSTIKRVGSFIGQGGTVPPPAAVASASSPVVNLTVVQQPSRGAESPGLYPARVLRLTSDALEVWSVSSGEGVGPSATDTLEVRRSLAGDVRDALRGRNTVLTDLAVAGFTADASPREGEASARWVLELLVLAVAVEEERRADMPKGAFSVHRVRVSPGAGGHWVSTSATVQLLSSYSMAEELPAPSFGAPLPQASLVLDKEAFIPGDDISSVPMYSRSNGNDRNGGTGRQLVAHVFWATPEAAAVWSFKEARDGGGERMSQWMGLGAVEVSTRVELLGGCIGGGASLHGNAGVVLVSAKGHALWVTPRQDGGRAVDIDSFSSKFSSGVAAEAWRVALLDAGLNSLEAGGTMDEARFEVGVLLRGLRGSGDAVSGDLDAAIVEVGREVLDGGGRQLPAFASPRHLVHLALREKARRHRCLLRFLMDAGALGASSIGRAALAEGGEKITAAARLCELQEADSVGARVSGLLEECFRLSLYRRREGTREDEEIRDRYFKRTHGVLDALEELHTPSVMFRVRKENSRPPSTILPPSSPVDAPSASIDGATVTPLERAMRDRTLEDGEAFGLLNQLSIVVAGVFEAALWYRASERSVYLAGPRGNVWTASSGARGVLRKQLKAYEAPGITATRLRERADVEMMRSVIGRLSVLLLDGFVDEAGANPDVSGRVDWEEEYVEAKDLCVRVLAGCGREELARFLADKHGYFEGTIRLCHEAELQQPGCPNGHSLLKSRMQPPTMAVASGEPDSFEGGESLADRKKRERFANVVLDWHLRRGLKTALLDVGEVVPSILHEFLADWKEAELLWMFEIRRGDHTGARWALLRGSPRADQKDGTFEAQHLWLSLAKLANLAGSPDPMVGEEIQNRLELMEVRERLMELLPKDSVSLNMAVMGGDQWTWRKALSASVEILSSFSVRLSHDEIEPEEVADVAYQGYKALVVGQSEASHEFANELWREMIIITLKDCVIGEAVAKGVAPSAALYSNAAVSGREMEVLWKRPTALHLLLRAIRKDQVRRKETPWGGSSLEGVAIELTDESLVQIVTELMPAGADGNGVSAEKWIVAIRKCPW